MDIVGRVSPWTVPIMTLVIIYIAQRAFKGMVKKWEEAVTQKELKAVQDNIEKTIEENEKENDEHHQRLYRKADRQGEDIAKIKGKLDMPN